MKRPWPAHSVARWQPPARHGLYSAQELYGDTGYRDSLDATAYAWSRAPFNATDALSAALHDHAIDTALASWIQGRRIVGVMGGHAVLRGSEQYADAARLGHALGAHFTVATVGGPGAMEAANLGAWFAQQSPAKLIEALDLLAAVPSFQPDIDAWAGVARDLPTTPAGMTSLGNPTGHHGTEQPTPFAPGIAQYFKKATREAILLQVCNAGIVFLPGAAGTVQEIFQDACENYYAEAKDLTAMVLVGREHWTETVPAWQLLHALAREHQMSSHIHLVDTIEEAVSLLVAD